MSEKSNLQQVFEAGSFAVTAEIGPPMSANPSPVTRTAKELLGVVDAANITDNQTSIVRMSSIAAGRLALNEGVEPVVQMTCRDRNRIAIQSDLLGAYALGMKNLLCLSGDHQTFGNHPQSKNVFDIDSIQLIKVVSDMKENGTLMNGRKSKFMPKFFIGTTINPFADPEELQLIRLRKKINAGAQFVQTQSVYDLDRFERWMEKVRALGLHKQAYIQAGVLVNKSLKSIEMTRQVPGMDIPEQLVERMRSTSDPRAEGTSIALEIIERVKKIEGISGVHIMAVGWEDIVPTIVKHAGLLPRPDVKKEEVPL